MFCKSLHLNFLWPSYTQLISTVLSFLNTAEQDVTYLYYDYVLQAGWTTFLVTGLHLPCPQVLRQRLLGVEAKACYQDL